MNETAVLQQIYQQFAQMNTLLRQLVEDIRTIRTEVQKAARLDDHIRSQANG